MTTLSKATLSALAASGTAAGGGLIYNNREKIFGKSEISEDKEVDNALESSRKAEGGPNSGRSPAGELPAAKVVGGGGASGHSNLNGQQSDGTSLPSSPVKGGDQKGAPGPVTPTPLGAKTNSPMDYQCSFAGKEYENEPNKKLLKQFLKDNGGEGQGLQILGPGDGEFKCAKDEEDNNLAGLKDYLNGLRSLFSISKTKTEEKPLVWAVKKEGENWNIYDGSGEEEGTLTAIEPEGNKKNYSS